MDVILDSNIYLQDTRMGGTQFQELFAYLRRTGSRLIIPMIVFHEVAERYRDRLREKVEAARKAWNDMRRTAISDIGNFPSPYINGEVRDLRDKLRKPAPGVQAVLYNDLSGVDVQEVLRRGIKRIRPANEEGEELRDVILWMIVLQFAKTQGTEVAFISNDSTFADAHKPGLHPQLVSDLASSNVKISFYRQIAEFVASEALETENITAEWLLSIIAKQNIEEEVKRQLAKSSKKSETVLNIELEELEFASGRKFKLTEDTFYVESSFSGSARTKVRETYTAAWPTGLFAGAPVPLSTLGGLGGGRLPGVGESFGFLHEAALRETQVKFRAVERDYKVGFELQISARIADGKLLAFQTDDFKPKTELDGIQFNSALAK